MSDLKDLLITKVNPHDDYDLIQKVGSGTYGEVYKAKCHATNRLAAIKIIKIEDQEDFESIESEIRLMKGCVHPNIVAFYASYIRRDKLYLSMEYCGGGSLQDIYHSTGPIPENVIAFVCREVLRGLSYLHSAANILLTDDAEVKLADFGVSAQITTTMNCKRRTFIGTPFWMAPEVAAVDRKGGYNQSCDIWSAGISAIELAELEPPMYDLHPMRALYIMSKSGFKPPTLKSKDKWSPVFHDFLKVALTKNPKKRPSAERLLTHAFVRCTIDKRIILNLIEKARNPNRYNLVLNELDPEDELELDLPHRITSKKSFRSEPDNRQYQPVRSQICKITDSESINNENYQKSQISSKKSSTSSECSSRLSENIDSLEGWMNNEQKKGQKSLLEIVDEELLQRGHKGSLTVLDKEFKSTLTKNNVRQFASYKNELPTTTCNRLTSSNNSTAFRGIKDSPSTEFILDHKSMIYGESVEHQSLNDNFQLLTKPDMQFDFLKEKYLINTNLTSETSTPVEEFDICKNFIYDDDKERDDDVKYGKNNYEDYSECDEVNDFNSQDPNLIDLKLATEHFEDYPSDSSRREYLESILEEHIADLDEEFEEANDELINLYASAISGLSISNNSVNLNQNNSYNNEFLKNKQLDGNYSEKFKKNNLDQTNIKLDQTDKIKLRKQVENRVECFKQNSKNRFSQQINCLNSKQVLEPKTKDDLACLEFSNFENNLSYKENHNLKKQDDQYALRTKYDKMMIFGDNDSSSDELISPNKNEFLKESLNNFSKQLTLLNEQDDRSKLPNNSNVQPNVPRDQQTIQNEQTYQDKLNQLSEWSIDTIETLINELCKEESLIDQPTKSISNNQTTENEEFSTPPSTPKSNGSPNNSLNRSNLDSSYQYATAKQNFSKSDVFHNQSNSSYDSQPPSAPPRRRRQNSLLATKTDNDNLANSSSSNSNKKNDNYKRMTNGLPPTPKVHMGACFSKVFNTCPLKINCCVSWVHQITRDEHLLFGCEEGIYTLNMVEIHEACLDQLFPRKTVWMYVIGNTLMSISGKTTHLYCHDLLQLHNRSIHNKDHNGKISQTMDQMINRIPEKFVPWKVSCTTKISSSKGVNHCCVVHNKSNGYKYLAGATANCVFLMQWYNPLNKFMLLKQYDLYLPAQIRIFEMIISPDLEYPLLCIGAKRCTNAEKIQLDLINLHSSSSWFSNEFGDGMDTVIPRNQVLNLICARQIDKDAILVCYDNIVRIVNLQGELKKSKKYVSEIIFEFRIESLVYLTDSVLAFHKHGMVGKSLKNCEITQEITDMSRIYRVLNMESKTIALESKPMDDLMGSSSNIYVLAGHESSY